MKTISIFLGSAFLSMFICQYSYSQKTIEGKSGNYTFSITKEVKPPILNVVDGSIRFVEPGGNNMIDATESSRLVFTLENTGIGDGTGLKLNVRATGDIQGITFPASKTLDVLKVGQKRKN